MKQASFAEIASVLRTRQSFVVMSHLRPDGDALGSTLALALSLRELGKDVDAWNEDGMLAKYSFLPEAHLLTRPPAEPRPFDVAVALDTATQNRLGTAAAAVRKADVWINIDHHATNPRYGDLVHIEPVAPATGEILYELLVSNDLPITREVAENLFAAISTDTGSFQYPNTTARTFEIGAELVRRGVNVGRMSQLLYENFPRRRLELLRDLLATMRFECGGRIALFALSLDTAQRLGVQPEDNEGLIDHLRAIEGVMVGIFFEELADGKVRVSMRSKSEAADVSAICGSFGGGGHKLAAGARVRGSLEDVSKRVVEKACDVLEYNS